MRSRLLVSSIFVCALAFAGLALTREHWWFRIPLRAVIEQSPEQRIELWRSATGNLLVNTDHELYFVAPQSNYIGVPNKSELNAFGVVALTANGPPLCVSMPSVKIQVRPNLVARNGILAFNRIDGRRIELHY